MTRCQEEISISLPISLNAIESSQMKGNKPKASTSALEYSNGVLASLKSIIQIGGRHENTTMQVGRFDHITRSS
jgi:hypothetical protein